MEFLEARLQKEIKTFRRLLQSQSRALSFDGIHDLRVCTRRLRVQISLIEKNTPYRLEKKTRQTLKKLGSQLGKRRQWDVTLKEAHRYHLEEQSLRKDRSKAGLKLQKILHSVPVQNLPKNLRNFERRLEKHKILIHQKTFKKLRSQMRAWMKQKHFSRKKLHELRIEAKKIRYTLEALDLPVNKLKDLQDQLGKSHDLTVLSEYFEDPKQLRKVEDQAQKKAQKQIRPALRSSLEVLKGIR